jgi:hypothetical protein
MVLNLLEAPILAFLLAYIIRYIDDPTSSIYIFRDNENIMPYLFMCTIVAMFVGLIVSAEEIYKDRKILKRESFLEPEPKQLPVFKDQHPVYHISHPGRTFCTCRKLHPGH